MVASYLLLAKTKSIPVKGRLPAVRWAIVGVPLGPKPHLGRPFEDVNDDTKSVAVVDLEGLTQCVHATRVLWWLSGRKPAPTGYPILLKETVGNPGYKP